MKKFMKASLWGLGAAVVLIVVPMLLVAGYVFMYMEPALDDFAQWAKTLPQQTDMPVYTSDNLLCLPDGTSFIPENVLEEQYDIRQKIDYSYPACIVGNELYMVHTIRRGGATDWCISAIRLDTREATLLYTWKDQSAVCNVKVYEDYRQRAAWYQDGMIYLNNQAKVLAYDIAQKNADTVPVQEFDFPERGAWAESADSGADTLTIHMNGAERDVTLKGLAEDNPAIGEVIERMLEKAGSGKHFVDPLSRVPLHTEDGNVWLLVRSVVYGGNPWMMFLRYDAQADQWLYAGCAHSWDGEPYDYYIVPVVDKLT